METTPAGKRDKAQWVHDCGACKWLGSDDKVDYYMCGGGPVGFDKNFPWRTTLISRWSDDGSDYASCSADMALKKLKELYGERGFTAFLSLTVDTPVSIVCLLMAIDQGLIEVEAGAGDGLQKG